MGSVSKHGRRDDALGLRDDRGRLWGWLAPVAGALTQEAIDVAVILNALRALGSGRGWRRATLPTGDAKALREEHVKLEASLDRLRDIVAALEVAKPSAGVELMREANAIIANDLAAHERTTRRKSIRGYAGRSPAAMA